MNFQPLHQALPWPPCQPLALTGHPHPLAERPETGPLSSRARWWRPRLALQVAALTAALGFSAMCLAADADRRVEQMRDAARRAQQALQQAQAEQGRLHAEKAALAAEQVQLQQGLQASERRQQAAARQAQALQAQLATAQAEQARLGTERDALKQALAEAQAGRDDALAQQRLARSQASAQRETLQAVLALLQRNVQALAQAEAHNRELLRLGQQAANAWAQATPQAMRSRDNPLDGLAAVHLEDQAETLRREMAQHQVLP